MLNGNGDDVSWTNEGSLNLVEAFWGRFTRRELTGHYSVELRSTAADGRFVLITLEFNNDLYVADMEMKNVRKIPHVRRDGGIGPVFMLSEGWPRKF